ncbi:MAG TPA: hypothetical protein EYG95_05780 [Campylobacterales bacterium]|nr:hypothetical protein [Campylobacterales bacterium]
MKKLFLLLLLSASSLLASIGEITALRGTADVIRGGVENALVVGSTLESGDEIKTAYKSKLQMVFTDKTVISLGQKSHFKVDEYIFRKDKVSAKFSLGKGFFKSITGKIGKISPKQFKIKTANATIGVRGTTIIGEVSSKLDIIACTQGQIVVSSAGVEVIVNAGERTIVEETKAPKQSQKVNAVLLKQLDKKSNPSQKEDGLSKTLVSTVEKDTKQESSEQTTQEKESDKFEPWVEEKDPHTLEDIQRIVGDQKPTYEGKVVEGSTSFGAIDRDSSTVKLGFDLGSGAMDGNIQFNDMVQDYDIDVAGKIQGDGSFDFNSNNGYDGGGEGTLSGDKLENANGTFGFHETDIMSEEINNIDGKFETSKK